jgi:DNA-binding NarL/FixJ family response regulator
MKKINVSIIAEPRVSMQACVELIEDAPGLHVIAMQNRLSGRATTVALAHTDVVIINAAIIELEGFVALQLLLDRYPGAKCLVVADNINKNNMIEVMSRGVRGVMCLDETPRLLAKAIRHLHAGEAWVSRGLLRPLRHALQSAQTGPHARANLADRDHWVDKS